jgi:hypothetical protein
MFVLNGCGETLPLELDTSGNSFFRDLEHHNDLDPDMGDHLWLLHHLFLDAINTDVSEWAESWNSHTGIMTIPNER